MEDLVESAEDQRGLVRYLDALVQRQRIDPDEVLDQARAIGLSPRGRGSVAQVESLRRYEPDELDPLADAFIRRFSRRAAARGFVTGAAGFVALPVALPAEAWGTVASVSKITSAVMNSYGYAVDTRIGADQLRLGVAAAYGIDKVVTPAGSKLLVREVARRLAVQVARQAWEDELGVIVPLTLRQLAIRAGAQWAWRNPAKVIPVIGGAVGATMSGSAARTVGRRTKTHYRDLQAHWRTHHFAEVEAQPRTP